MSFLTGGQEIMTAAASENVRNHAAFIWSVADLLRGDYKQSEYGRVILPLTVLRRLDCVLEPTKAKVLDEPRAAGRQGRATSSRSCVRPPARAVLQHLAADMTPAARRPGPHRRQPAQPTSPAFSPARRDIFEKFDFDTQIDRLDRADLLYLVVSQVRRDRPAPRQRSPTWRWATSSRS